MTPVEFWLPIGAIAFYAYDAALLLWQNELVYLRAGRHWRVTGGTELRLASRRLFLPNLLLPHRPQFLVCWHSTGAHAGQDNGGTPDALFRALRPIGVLNTLQAGLLAALPAALWSVGAGTAALVVFALFYLLTVAALCLMFLRRARLALATRACWSLAFDALACAPFAINLTRKIAMRHGLAGEPLRYAALHFDAPTLQQARTLVTARIREEHAAPEALEQQQQISRAVLARLEP